MNLVTQMNSRYHTVLCIPRGLYLYLEGAQTVPDPVENLRKGIALDTLGAVARPVQDDSKPTVQLYIGILSPYACIYIYV